MENVDYQKLSEQYASFLVAIGGVSITVLTLVLSLNQDSKAPELTEAGPRSFLVAALVVAVVSCFIGAHMMAETAAFINKSKNKDNADRLFLVASSNIFISIVLVLFALMLLPLVFSKVHLASIKPICIGLFFLIVAGAIYWAVLAGTYRMRVKGSKRAIIIAAFCGSISFVALLAIPLSNNWLLWLAFAPSALVTAVSLAWFAWIFKDGTVDSLREARIKEIRFFSISIIVSYASLLAAGFKTMFGTSG